MEAIEELRRLIARCCAEADAAGVVAMQALRAGEREAKRRQELARELRARLAVLEERMRQGRAR